MRRLWAGSLNRSLQRNRLAREPGWVWRRFMELSSSQVGQGTIFKIFLPSSKEPVQAVAEKMDTSPFRGGHETILVVEDDPALRSMANEALKTAGYQVLQAASGVDALKIWSAQKENIDLLFSDLVMPEGMNGGQLAEQLSARKPGLKVILTTGHSSLPKNGSGLGGALLMDKTYS